MEVNVIETYESFFALETAWNEIYSKDPDANFFLSWSWFSRVFQEYPREWSVLAVTAAEAEKSYVCFLPIRIITVWSKRKAKLRNEIHMAGTLFWGQYTGFICDPNWDEAAIPCIASYLQRMHWSRLSLKYLLASDKRIDLFISAFSAVEFRTTFHERWINEGKTNNLICPYIELPAEFDTYLNSNLSSNTRQKVRRYMRHFLKSDKLRITTTDPDTLDRDIVILTDLWMRMWCASKGKKTEGLASKYRRILRHVAMCDSLQLSVVWCNDTPLVALANFLDRKKKSVYFFVTGRDQNTEYAYVGLIAHIHSIRWAIENGFRRYDFCHGNEPYKYSYGAIDRELKHLIVSTRSGVNLHGLLDPSSVPGVMQRIVKLIDENRLADARVACRQVEKTLNSNYRGPGSFVATRNTSNN